MKKLCILMLLGVLCLFSTKAQQTDTWPRITGLMLSRGTFTGLNVKTCDSLQTLECNNNELRTIQGGSRVLKTFRATQNHLSFSQLLPFVHLKPIGALYELSPQTDKVRLMSNEEFDLSEEMKMDACATRWSVSGRYSSSIEDGVYEENNGVFRFLKAGYYKLVLLNDALMDDHNETKRLVEFVWNIDVYYTLTVLSNNDDFGTVSVEERDDMSTYAYIRATPKDGYKFVHWKKGEDVFSTLANQSVEITENMTLTAYFEKMAANEDVPTSKVLVYTEGREICISESMEQVQVFNAFGQCVYSGTDNRVPVKTSGLYVVRIGTQSYKVTVK